jgi:hypothetical protein
MVVMKWWDSHSGREGGNQKINPSNGKPLYGCVMNKISWIMQT